MKLYGETTGNATAAIGGNMNGFYALQGHISFGCAPIALSATQTVSQPLFTNTQKSERQHRGPSTPRTITITITVTT